MQAILRKYLDLETQLDRLAKRVGAPNFKDLVIVPAVDVLVDVTKIIISFGIQPSDLIQKCSELRGEAAGKTMYLKDGAILSHQFITGSIIQLAAAHLLQAE